MDQREQTLGTIIAHHPLWHLCGAALFLLLAGIHRRARTSGVLVAVLWNLAGVIIHELAHLLVGTLLRAKPVGFSLVPRREGAGWRLGCVRFRRITPFNAVPVALAPLGLFGLAYWLARQWFDWYKTTLVATLSLYAVLFVLLYNALPSRQDLRVAGNWRSMLIYLPPLVALAWYCALPSFDR